MWVDTGTGESGKLEPIDWGAHRITDEPVEPDPSSGCFIATAAYGSFAASEVISLRMFRDGFLMSSAPGRFITGAYYRFSPAFAEALQENRVLRFMARIHLAPFVKAAEAALNMN